MEIDVNKIIDILLDTAQKNDMVLNSEDLSKYADPDSEEYEQIEDALERKGVDILYEEDLNENEEYENYDQIVASCKSNDSISQYLHEISIFPLLTHEEEIEYSKKISKGIELQTHPEMWDKISAEEGNRILEEAEYAKNRLVNCNLKLVVSIAKKFYGNYNISLLDLIQEGNMGLIKSIEKYDANKGFKFSTYATWWIRQSIARALADQSRTIRIPVHVSETKAKITKAKRALVQEYGREPNCAQIAEYLGISEKKVQELESYDRDILSLEKKVGDDQDATLGDFIPDNTQLTPLQYTMQIKLHDELEEILSKLSDKERKVIILRFGLNGGGPKTLEEVSKEFDVTRERVRQIEAKALRKIKPYAKRLGLEHFQGNKN